MTLFLDISQIARIFTYCVPYFLSFASNVFVRIEYLVC